MSNAKRFPRAERAGHHAAEAWFGNLGQRLDLVSPYLAPSMLAETFLALPVNQQRAFLDGIGAILATSLARGPANPGKFECAGALHLMALPLEQQALLDEIAELEESGGAA